MPDLAVNKQVIFFARSDHASFWAVGIDAILVNEDIDVLYPQYHTFQDTWENTFPEWAAPIQIPIRARPASSSSRRLLGSPSSTTLPIWRFRPANWSWRPTPETRAPESPMRLVARVHNLGAS